MKAIRSKTDKNGIVHIEVDDELTIVTAQQSGGTIASAGKAVELTNKFGEVGTVIADVCKTIQARLQTSLEDAKPDEFTLEFGIKLAGESGVPFVTKGSVEGTFQVKATWKLE